MAPLPSKSVSQTKRTVVFFHPDLGIGGAERLVIDVAVGLQNLGNRVVIFTSHCDPTHSFDEARDGTLDVRVRGNTIIPPSILSRFSILCAILRQLHLLIQIDLTSNELRELQPHAFFVDQLSAINPFLRGLFPSARILFYCHFPDKLLAQRTGTLKKLYRLPFDWIESATTDAADAIVVNSSFTRDTFHDAFPRLRHRKPAIVYPCVDVKGVVQNENSSSSIGVQNNDWRKELWKGKKVILSINRFERKKDVGLAIGAFAGLDNETRHKTRLVIAGGYDVRVPENVQYHKELITLAESLKLSTATASNLITALSIPSDIEVLFLLSVPSSLKSTLLEAAHLLVYTPGNEHFGIVPLEAMLARVPVLAANTGGPTETVIDKQSGLSLQTGWLKSVEAVEEWTEVMRLVLDVIGDEKLEKMGEAGRSRVIDSFSKEKMAESLQHEIDEMTRRERKADVVGPSLVKGVFVVCMLTVVLASFFLNLYYQTRPRHP